MGKKGRWFLLYSLDYRAFLKIVNPISPFPQIAFCPTNFIQTSQDSWQDEWYNKEMKLPTGKTVQQRECHYCRGGLTEAIGPVCLSRTGTFCYVWAQGHLPTAPSVYFPLLSATNSHSLLGVFFSRNLVSNVMSLPLDHLPFLSQKQWSFPRLPPNPPVCFCDSPMCSHHTVASPHNNFFIRLSWWSRRHSWKSYLSLYPRALLQLLLNKCLLDEWMEHRCP